MMPGKVGAMTENELYVIHPLMVPNLPAFDVVKGTLSIASEAYHPSSLRTQSYGPRL